MSGPFGAGALQFFGGADDFYSHKINQSLRFEDGDNPYLYRTPSSVGNRRTFTVSAWVKRGDLNTSAYIIKANTSTGDALSFRNTSTGTSPSSLFFFLSDTTQGALYTTQKFRDTGGWYHIVAAIDTTQSTASNRVKLYVNGQQITAFDTASYPSQNYDCTFNTAVSHQVGAYSNGTAHFDGYMAEVNFIDGLQLDPTSFGETKAGIWIPKDTSGLTFGTNGFRLKFQDSSALGDDTSGNDNDFTSSGLAATDVVLDSPSNNFCTLNPLFTNAGTSQTFAEGNLKFTADSNYALANGTFAMRSGKWYWETLIQTQNYSNVGITRGTNTGGNSYVGYDPNGNVFGFGYQSTFIYGASGDGTASGATLATGQVATTYTTGDIIGCSFDADAGELKFYKNNSLIYTVSSINTHDWMPANSAYGTSNVNIVNFGQDSSFAGNKTSGSAGASDANGVGDFFYTPPSGFLALCTANLPDPAIDPAQDEEPADFFNTVLYTGNSGTQNVTGVGFQPDWVWIKPRNLASNHVVHTSTFANAYGYLIPNATTAENTTANYDWFKSFDSDGFTVVYSSSNSTTSNNWNGNYNYVAWNWLAGGSASSNTDGSITSSVSANTKAGFSVLTYTGTGSTATVGHGLNSAPDFIIVKSRDNSRNWRIYNSISGATKYLGLNSSNAEADSDAFWNDTDPTSSVFTVKTATTVNGSSEDYVAYCFHSVDGYSKVGSFIGNGSTDGPFVYTGFRPAWLMLKRTNSTSNWSVLDSQRNTYNVVTSYIDANVSSAEATNFNWADFTSNGFKLRGTNSTWNASGSHYIFLCFAEQPFKYSNAR